MSEAQDVQFRVKKINELLADYIPPRDAWNPADESVFKPIDLYRVPLEEAQDMQLKAIKFTFTHHYRNNEFYHKYCEMRNVRPDDINTTDDLDTIPLIPDTTFKEYPSGKDFAHWLANVFTGELPKIVIKDSNPTYDDVINAFNASGLAVSYSSGTSGRHTFIPRDQKTFRTAQLALAKCRASMIDISADRTFVLSPNPAKTNVFAGKLFTFVYTLVDDIEFAIDRELTTDIIKTAMSEKVGLKGKLALHVQNRTTQKIVDRVIQWLERYGKTEGTIELSGMPFLLYQVMNSLQKEGKAFDFGERGQVLTGGGWKINENARIPHADFRKLIQDVLGIPGTRCLDLYGMVEGNGWMVQCPEGHFLHTPYTFYKPLVLDDDLMPAEYGEWGRFAFLDAIAQSYPGFIISGDRVRLLERCPACDRLGPVLEPEVRRAKGEEVRGCAEELRRTLAQDLAR
jgi:long-chain-fatty-acid---luciferin-component ligase